MKGNQLEKIYGRIKEQWYFQNIFDSRLFEYTL